MPMWALCYIVGCSLWAGWLVGWTFGFAKAWRMWAKEGIR